MTRTACPWTAAASRTPSRRAIPDKPNVGQTRAWKNNFERISAGASGARTRLPSVAGVVSRWRGVPQPLEASHASLEIRRPGPSPPYGQQQVNGVSRPSPAAAQEMAGRAWLSLRACDCAGEVDARPTCLPPGLPRPGGLRSRTAR